MDAALVSDDITIGMIRERMASDDQCRHRTCPRTVAGEALDAMLADQGIVLDRVIEIQVDERPRLPGLGGQLKQAGQEVMTLLWYWRNG